MRTLDIRFDDGTASLDALGGILVPASGLESLSTDEGFAHEGFASNDASDSVFLKYLAASNLRHVSLFSEATTELVRSLPTSITTLALANLETSSTLQDVVNLLILEKTKRLPNLVRFELLTLATMVRGGRMRRPRSHRRRRWALSWICCH